MAATPTRVVIPALATGRNPESGFVPQHPFACHFEGLDSPLVSRAFPTAGGEAVMAGSMYEEE
jgi:hypothetical protein